MKSGVAVMLTLMQDGDNALFPSLSLLSPYPPPPPSCNPLLSDHALITFDFLLLDDLPSAKSVYTRHLSDQTVSQFKEEILSVFSSVPCLNVAVDPFSDVNSSPAQIDQIVECAAGSLRSTLDLIAPLKKKDLKPKKRAPWFNSQTRELKKTTQKLKLLERKNKLNLPERIQTHYSGRVKTPEAIEALKIALTNHDWQEVYVEDTDDAYNAFLDTFLSYYDRSLIRYTLQQIMELKQQQNSKNPIQVP
ncbi:uncharacterized protein V6R79_013382 [Siganus canaliculatus]